MPRPTARVLALLELLQSGGVRPVRELADALGVDERTVRRYVLHLIDLEVPVESVRGRYGGYRLAAGARLPPLMLTDEEALAAALGLIAAERSGLVADGLAAATASAKLRRVLPERLADRLDALLGAVRFTGEPSPGAPPDPAVLLLAAEAARDLRPLEIEYANGDGERTARTVLPWGVVAHAGRWYVTGPDSTSRELRTFRLDRIGRARIGTGRFPAPDGFDAARHVVAALATAPWANDVAVLLRTDAGRARSRFPEGVALLETVRPADAPDGQPGWVRVRLRAEHLDWVAAALAALDVPFVIEAPELLRDEVVGVAERLAARAAVR